MGISGVIWCVFAGLCYGSMNVFAKLAYSNGMLVTRFIMMRFFLLAALSYIVGKSCRKQDFDIRKLSKNTIGYVILASSIGLVSKSMQYSAVKYIPLSMSSCVSFTSGPIFAGLLAFLLIREKLSIGEIIAILFGIVGTMMLTMP
jgi:drug/metabolite transporter (DMT)-like permease